MSWSLSQSDLMATSLEGNVLRCPARARLAAAPFIVLNKVAMYSPRPTCAKKGQHFQHISSPPPSPLLT
jgi:hypothetical protein